MEFIFGLVLLVLDIWALLNVWRSGSSTGGKLLWTIGVIVFPLVGFLVWLFAGPRSGAAATR